MRGAFCLLYLSISVHFVYEIAERPVVFADPMTNHHSVADHHDGAKAFVDIGNAPAEPQTAEPIFGEPWEIPPETSCPS